MIGNIVKKRDPDRYLLSMFASPADREALWALFVFNHEIAKTREVVSETQLGLIRLQWWRDEIARIYEEGRSVESDVLVALSQIIHGCGLPREDFEMLIHAREFDLEDVLPGNIEGLVNYADFTTTPLMNLALRICGGEPDLEPVRQVAINYALAGILRAVVFHARHRRCYLPEDLLKAHQVSVNKLYELKPQEGLADVVKAVAEQEVPGVKASNRFLKASQALAHVYFKHFRCNQYDVFSPKTLMDPPFKALRVALGAGF